MEEEEAAKLYAQLAFNNTDVFGPPIMPRDNGVNFHLLLGNKTLDWWLEQRDESEIARDWTDNDIVIIMETIEEICSACDGV